jgi:hypothetical protein
MVAKVFVAVAATEVATGVSLILLPGFVTAFRRIATRYSESSQVRDLLSSAPFVEFKRPVAGYSLPTLFPASHGLAQAGSLRQQE